MTFSLSVVLFSIIFIGIYISRVKIKGFSLDLSAVLIVAILFGWLGENFKLYPDGNEVQVQLELLSGIGTSIFVATVGILTGQGIRKGGWQQSMKAFTLGILGVLAGYVCMRGILLFDRSMDRSVLYGVFCGAMTSTPALAAVCEVEHLSAEMAALGYGCAYIPGVLSIVFFVQRYKRDAVLMEQKAVCRENVKIHECEMVLAGIAVCAVLGNWLGRWHIPLFNFALGSTGGILIISVMFGLLSSRRSITYDQKQLTTYRNLGLMVFFVATGIRAGRQLTDTPQPKWVFYGIIMTAVAMIVVYASSRLIWNINLFEVMCITAGAMTSTPAMGILLKKYGGDKMGLLSYSASYLGALLCVVLLVQI